MQLLTLLVGWMVSHNLRYGFTHLPQGIDHTRFLGLPLSRCRHWNRNALLRSRLRSSSQRL
jgi:hypothetical protein